MQKIIQKHLRKLETLTNQQIVFLTVGFSFLLVILALIISAITGKTKTPSIPPVATTPSAVDTGATIATTVFPIYDIVKNIVGDGAQVELLVPAGATPHNYELSPSQVAKANQADVIFAIGNNYDNWVLDQSGTDSQKFITLDKDITLFTQTHLHDSGAEDDHDSASADPHYWLSIPNVMLMSAQVRDELSQQYPEASEMFAHNQNEYAKNLARTDAKLRQKLVDLPTKKIATLHNAWQYLANDYGLEVVTVFEHGSEGSLTAADIAEFQTSVTSQNLKAIFSEPQLTSSEFTQAASDIGLPVFELDPIGGQTGKDTLIALFEYNFNTIARALSL